MVNLYHTATEYLANEITLTRGTVDDIIDVGVYHTTDAAKIPEASEFQIVQLVEPGDPLAEGTKIDILSLVGPESTSPNIVLTAGTYQRWVMVRTAVETIIRKVDVVEVS